MTSTLLSTQIQTKLQTLVENCTRNYTSSTCFMKQLTAIAISTITYIRHICSKDNYNTENFHELTLNVLKSKCNDEYAQNVSDTIHGAFAAIDKKYLDTLALIFHVNDPIPENIIESFRFEYTYSKTGYPFTIITKNKYGWEEIKKIDLKTIQMSTTSMLQCCQRSLTAPMPDDLNMSVKLYYKSDTPKGYQAPGFKPNPSIFDDFDQQVGKEGHTHMQQVMTPFHKLDMKCWVNNAVNVSYDAEPPSSLESSESSNKTIKCNCRATSSDIKFGRKLEIIKCTYCQYWQHAICYGYFSASSLTSHCCYLCARDHPERTPTDQTLQKTDRNDTARRTMLCITRRTLEWFTHIEYVSGNSIMEYWGINDKDTFTLIKELGRIDVIKQCDENESLTNQTKHIILQNNLNKILKKIFNNYKLTECSNKITDSPIIPCARNISTVSLKTSHNLNDTPAILEQNSMDESVSLEPPLPGPSSTHSTVKMMHQLSSTHLKPQKRYNTNYQIPSILKRRKL